MQWRRDRRDRRLALQRERCADLLAALNTVLKSQGGSTADRALGQLDDAHIQAVLVLPKEFEQVVNPTVSVVREWTDHFYRTGEKDDDLDEKARSAVSELTRSFRTYFSEEPSPRSGLRIPWRASRGRPRP